MGNDRNDRHPRHQENHDPDLVSAVNTPYQHQWIASNKLANGERLLTANGAPATVIGGSVPTARDGWMWDLTVPGNNDHDFYVDAGDTPVLVHNTCGPTDDPAGESRTYIDRTTGGSVRNVGTSTTHTEFADALTDNGWSAESSKDGTAQIFTKDGAKYVLREKASTYEGWSAEFTPAGAKRATLKIRLGVPG
jgi:hypothetical protein